MESMGEISRGLVNSTDTTSFNRRIPPTGHVLSLQEGLADKCSLLCQEAIFSPAPKRWPSSLNRQDPSPFGQPSVLYCLYEALPSNATYNLVCPSATLPGVTDAGINGIVLQFGCHCESVDHKNSLRYISSSGWGVPIEEAGPEAIPSWQMVVQQWGTNRLISLRLAYKKASPEHFDQLAALSGQLATVLVCKYNICEGGGDEALTFSAHLQRAKSRRLLNLSIVKSKLVSAKGSVTREYTVPWRPKCIQLLQYSTASRRSLDTPQDSDCEATFLDEPDFYIYLSEKHPTQRSENTIKIRVSSESRLVAAAEPSCIAVISIECSYGSKSPRVVNCSEIHLEFSSREDREAFSECIHHMQRRIFHTSLMKPLWGEDVLYRGIHQVSGPEAAEQPGVCAVVVKCSKPSGSAEYRLILTYGENGSICFGNLGPEFLESSAEEWRRLLPSLTAWTIERQRSGQLEAKRQTWKMLQDSMSSKSNTKGVKRPANYITGDAETSAEAWFQELDELNLVLRARKSVKKNDPHYTPVKIAIIDMGFDPERSPNVKLEQYMDLVTAEKAEGGKGIRQKAGMEGSVRPGAAQPIDKAGHGTTSVELIFKVYNDAKLYVYRILESNDEDSRTGPYLMADAIEWATHDDVDIISISAGFKWCPQELRHAVSEAHKRDILIFAAAGNWALRDPPAFPANIKSHVFCIFAADGGLRNSRSLNPQPRDHAHNFAFLGTGITLPGRGEIPEGTSAATAIAAGFAARVMDFARQPDCRKDPGAMSSDHVHLLPTMAGITAVFEALANSDGRYQCVRPGRMLEGADRDDDGHVDVEEGKVHVKKFLSEALKRA